MTVIVLGNRLTGSGVHPELAGRMDAGIDLFEQLDARYLVVSGGRGGAAVRDECEVMREYAVARGVDRDRVVTEPDSRDTIGNGYFSRRVVDGLADRRTVTVVTSAYHVPRADFVFRRCFGDGYRVQTLAGFGPDPTRVVRGESWKCVQTRRFFEGVRAGDLREIRRRLRSRHSRYDEDDFDGPGPEPPAGRPAERPGQPA